MREVERLAREVGSTLSGDPWHGPSVMAVLSGIDAAAAGRRAIPGAHTIAELVLHMAAWTRETTRRLRGGAAGAPAEGDWPAPRAATAEAWRAALAELRLAHEELAAELVRHDDADLDRPVAGGQRDALGEIVTLRRTVAGLLQHDAYHAGQAALLRKLAAGAASSSAPSDTAAAPAAPVRLDDDMRAVIAAQRLGYAATVTPEGRPNLSPKGTIRVLDDRRLFFCDIASPNTRANLAANPWIELNVVDPLSRRGWRFLGRATLHAGDEVHRRAVEQIDGEEGVHYHVEAVVVIELERALPLRSPGYDHVPDEAAMRARWTGLRRRLDEEFERHLAERRGGR